MTARKDAAALNPVTTARTKARIATARDAPPVSRPPGPGPTDLYPVDRSPAGQVFPVGGRISRSPTR